MPNEYPKMSKKARAHWNEYAKNYNKRMYKTIAVRLNYETDAEVIKFLQDNGKPAVVLKNLAREAASKK